MKNENKSESKVKYDTYLENEEYIGVSVWKKVTQCNKI